MADHLTPELIEAFRNKSASPEQLRTIDDHLAECDECAALLVSPEERQRSAAALHAYFLSHLSYEQRAAFVDGKLKPEEAREVESHIAACRACREEVQNLRDIQAEMQSAPVIGRKQAAAFRFSVWMPALSLVSAGVAGVLVWVVIGHRVQTAQKDVARLETAQQRLRQESAQKIADAQANATKAQRDKEQALKIADARTQENAILKRENEAMTRNQKNGLPLPPVPSNPQQIAMNTDLQSIPIPGVPPSRGGFAPKRPVGTIVLSNEPTLVWDSAAYAVKYRVVVKDKDGKPVRTPLPIEDVKWRVTPALERDKTYSWLVTPLDATGKPLQERWNAEPRFRVPDRAISEHDIEAQLRLAALLAHDGFLEDAEALLTQITEDDLSSPVAKRAALLLEDIRKQRLRKLPGKPSP